jgi:histidinol-phosphate phosphatase family protein
VSFTVVIPTSGRPSLDALLEGLGDVPVIVVRDRDGRGPAAARNAGWRAARTEWVVFLDDDVLPLPEWRSRLEADLAAAAAPDVGGVQGRVVVPEPERPTDWERNVAGLERARWATADMAYRRAALASVGGFDERFPRAYREDADLGLRVTGAGRRIVPGRRAVLHPVRPAPSWVSLAKQAGNADDPLMRALHGRDWRERAGVPRGRRRRHLAVATAGTLALAGGVVRPRRWPRPAPPPHQLAAAAWLGGTAELAWARISPGPRTPREVATMAWTSAALPFAAAGWWLRGLAGLPRALRAGGPRPWPAAVLFDRDGTLIADVPYNGDPARVAPMPGARAALDRLRAAGVPVGVVSNQSGVARGLLSEADVAAVNRRMEALLGPLGPIEVCPHGPDDGCGCRKPAPGLIVRAARRLGVDPGDCVVVGDIGADVEAAHAAGARGILVPTPRTRHQEIAAAPERAADLGAAVDRLIGADAPGLEITEITRASIPLEAAA